MEAYNISSREADVAYLECVQATQSYNDYMDAFYFEEAGEGNDQNIVQKLIEKIKSLAAAIAKFFSDFFASAKAKLFKQKADEALEDKELAAKKVEVLDAGRIVKFTKTYQKRISDAKSVEEIDKIVAEYEKKRNVAGVFAVTATLAAAIGVYVHHAQNHIKKAKEVNDYGQALLAKEQKAIAEQLEIGRKVHKGAQDYAKETGTKYDPKGLLDASADYQGAKHRTEALRAEREAYKNSKGYKKYVANEPSKMERLAARKANAIAKVTSDGMNAVKGAFSGGISKITKAIGGAVSKASNAATERKATAEDKNFKNLVGAKTESADDDFGEGSYFFGEIQMESGDMSTEDLFGVDPFSESADELFEESSLSDIGSKISNAIKKIIEKIKKLYADLRDKFAAAKYAAVLRSQAASSTRQIKFNMRDKEITKAVKELMIASNKAMVESKKVEQAYVRGKITTYQMNDKIDVINTDLEREIDRIMNSPYGRSVQSKLEDTYAANRVQSYCQKLLNYQQKTAEELRKSIESEEERLLKEAAELERAEAQAAAELAAEAKRKASVKYKLAQWYARTNKKVLGSVVTVIGVGAAIGAFAAKINLNKKSKAVHESAGDDMIVDEAYLEAVEASLTFEYGIDWDSDTFVFEEDADSEYGDDELFTEGAANREIKAEFTAAFNTFKAEMTASRACKKSGKYDNAITHAKKAKEAMDNVIKKIHDVDDTIGDAITGLLFQGLINCAKITVVSCVTFGFGGPVESLRQFIGKITATYSDFKNKDAKIRHWFNNRRSEFISNAQTLSKFTEKYISNLEALKKASVEESAEDDFLSFEGTTFMEESLDASGEYDEAYLEAVESALAFEYGVDLDSDASFTEDTDDFSDVDSLFTEGAGNQQIRGYFKEAFDTYKTEVKAGRACYKAKKFDEGINHLKKARNAMLSALNKMRSVNDSIGDAISGLFLQGLINSAKILLVTIVSFGILGPVAQLKMCIANWVGIVDDFKEGNTMIRHWFNTMRSQTIGEAKMLVSICDTMIKRCENGKKMAKDLAMSESADDLFGDDFDEFTESTEESILGDEMDELFGLI